MNCGAMATRLSPIRATNNLSADFSIRSRRKHSSTLEIMSSASTPKDSIRRILMPASLMRRRRFSTKLALLRRALIIVWQAIEQIADILQNNHQPSGPPLCFSNLHCSISSATFQKHHAQTTSSYLVQVLIRVLVHRWYVSSRFGILYCTSIYPAKCGYGCNGTSILPTETFP